MTKTQQHVKRGEAVRLLKRLLDQINDVVAVDGDAAALCERYRAAGDAVVDGRYDEAKLILTSGHRARRPAPAPGGVVIKIAHVARRGLKSRPR